MSSAYNLDNISMSATDAAIIEQLQKDWENAHAAKDAAGMKKAHESAEIIRSKYGFTMDGGLTSAFTTPAAAAVVGNAGLGGAGLDVSAAGMNSAVKVGIGVLLLVMVIGLIKG